MHAQMALIRVAHARIEPRSIPRYSTLKRGDDGIEILGELLGVEAVQFSLDDRGDLADLQGRESQANAVERVDGITRIADDVPTIVGIALAAFPHVGVVVVR